MKRQTILLTAIALTAAALIGTWSLPTMAEETRQANQLVHKALKDRTKTFCKAVLPAWFNQQRENDLETFRTLVADCYLGHARLTILGVDDNLSLKEVGLSELPSALLAHETGMTLNVYRPLAGRTIKDYPKRN